jgi:hypothetical protein
MLCPHLTLYGLHAKKEQNGVVKNYLTLWDEGWLKAPITVIGEHIQGAKSEFAKVRLTLNPAKAFEVEDCVEDKEELEKLNVGWPDSFIIGMLDVLMKAEPDPLTKVRVTLEQVWYHDADSSREAFCNAGRDAGRKIIAVIDRRRS